MFNIYVRFDDSERFEDTFNPIDDIDTAKHFAKRWKQGVFTYFPDAVQKVRVVDTAGNVVYEI